MPNRVLKMELSRMMLVFVFIYLLVLFIFICKNCDYLLYRIMYMVTEFIVMIAVSATTDLCMLVWDHLTW